MGERRRSTGNALTGDYSRIRDHIAAVLPDLFYDYNQRIDHPDGFYLGNSAARRQWKTAPAKPASSPCHPQFDPAGRPVALMTMRTHDQFNTTIYDNDDRYRGVYGTRLAVFMNADDLHQRGLKDGDSVDVESHSEHDDERRIARGFRVVSFDVPRGCCAMYFPEANVLVPRQSYAIGSRTPLSKFVPVTVRRRGRLSSPVEKAAGGKATCHGPMASVPSRNHPKVRLADVSPAVTIVL